MLVCRYAFCKLISFIVHWLFFVRLVRSQIGNWDAAELIVVASPTVDRKEDGALEKHIHDDMVTTRTEQSMQSAPCWLFECSHMTVR